MKMVESAVASISVQNPPKSDVCASLPRIFKVTGSPKISWFLIKSAIRCITKDLDFVL